MEWSGVNAATLKRNVLNPIKLKWQRKDHGSATCLKEGDGLIIRKVNTR